MFGTGRLGTSRFTGSGFGNRFGNGFGGVGFHGRGWGCWNCGFGFGFGFGGFGWGWGWGWNWGWGWGLGPWWWNNLWFSPWYSPWWWGGPVGSVAPYWGDPTPPNYQPDYPPPYQPGDDSPDNSGAYQNAPAPQDESPAQQPSTPPQDSSSIAAQGVSNSAADTGNVAESRPTVLLYLTDGTTFAATDYWIANNQLHYRESYGGEGTLELDQVDWSRTISENAKRGVPFKLKPQPVQPMPAPAQTDKATPVSSAAAAA
jgi:hypothetical protein